MFTNREHQNGTIPREKTSLREGAAITKAIIINDPKQSFQLYLITEDQICLWADVLLYVYYQRIVTKQKRRRIHLIGGGHRHLRNCPYILKTLHLIWLRRTGYSNPLNQGYIEDEQKPYHQQNDQQCRPVIITLDHYLVPNKGAP